MSFSPATRDFFGISSGRSESDPSRKRRPDQDDAVRALGQYTQKGYGLLLGSDGRVYMGADAVSNKGAIRAHKSDATISEEWAVGVGKPVTLPPTMSCAGILYTGAADVIYAVVTDADGLADAPWPKFQHDTRNSGNADATTKWGVRTGGTCVQ